jgi:hypothetical protein
MLRKQAQQRASARSNLLRNLVAAGVSLLHLPVFRKNDPAHAGCYAKTVAANVSSLYLLPMQPEPATAPNRLSGRGSNRSFYLPRLDRENYQGDAECSFPLPAQTGRGIKGEGH